MDFVVDLADLHEEEQTELKQKINDFLAAKKTEDTIKYENEDSKIVFNTDRFEEFLRQYEAGKGRKDNRNLDPIVVSIDGLTGLGRILLIRDISRHIGNDFLERLTTLYSQTLNLQE